LNKKITITLIIAIIIGSTFGIIFISYIVLQNISTSTPYYEIIVYDPNKAFNGTTLFTDVHDPLNPKVVEVDMTGKIIWEYIVPSNLRKFIEPGMDSELLPNGNILIVLPQYGVIEVNRSGNIVWQHLDNKISHDADRLPNGNTIYIWGGNDTYSDPQVKEINSTGGLVWSWRAYDYLYNDTYKNISREGWTHANAVTRLSNNNTLISLRNFNITIEVNKSGAIIWAYNWTQFGTDPHEPEIQPNNNLLVGLQRDPLYNVVEINRTSGAVVWNYTLNGLRTVRDSDRLPNGNTLIQGVMEDGQESTLIEVTQSGEIVWQLNLKNAPAYRSPGRFYKAQRIPA